jgi:hypothetical protein
MTIEFIKPEGSYTNAIKISMNVPNLYGTIQLATQSRFSKNLHTFDLTVIETNDRYTEFATDYTDELGDYDISGLFNYTLYQNGEPLFDGLLKFVNNKTESLENKIKYVSPNENGDSYIIYD